MLERPIFTRHYIAQPSLLLASVILFMALGNDAHIGGLHRLNYSMHAMAPDRIVQVPVAPATPAPAAPIAPPVSANSLNLHILTPSDEALYNAVFAAQSAADWAAADAALAQISDKRLLGHVLGDRYQRRRASLPEMQAWLAAYPTLPEAAPFYAFARRLPEGKTARLTAPIAADSWAGGGDSYSAPFGFSGLPQHAATSPDARKLAAKIERALARDEIYTPKALIEAEQKRRYIPPAELAVLENRVAAGFMHAGKVDIARAWAAAATQADPAAMWTYGLTAWRQGDASVASGSFAGLAQRSDVAGPNRSAAAFWAYRAYRKAGDKKQASYWLKQAALQPHSFYGFLATSLLGEKDVGSWQVPSLDDTSIAAIAAQPAGWRALALLQLGHNDMAQAELRRINPAGDRALQSAMLAVAEAAHMPTLALQLGGLPVDQAGKPYDAAFYPVPPWQPAAGFQIDRALLYALMRHESGFNPSAVSDRGACGLMQLMPATAQLISDEKLGNHCTGKLREPAFNLGLGQDYVQRLSSDPAIGSNLVLLLAAYNGGPARVAQWLSDDARHDPLLFIEGLPVRETRDYVQQVLVHYWMYRARLGLPLNSLTQLARGEWPRYALTDERPARPVSVASNN